MKNREGIFQKFGKFSLMLTKYYSFFVGFFYTVFKFVKARQIPISVNGIGQIENWILNNHALIMMRNANSHLKSLYFKFFEFTGYW